MGARYNFSHYYRTQKILQSSFVEYLFYIWAMKNKKAIATIAIGEKYLATFNNICCENWEAYGDRFGYDIILITSPLDVSQRAMNRSASWQKLLILSQSWSNEYERIVWVDLDVIINNTNAYDICDGVPIDMVGAVDAYSIPTKEIHDISLKRMYANWFEMGIPFIDNLQPGAYYTNRGIPGGDLDSVVQAGVFVCSPNHHKEIFESIYYKYEDTNGAEWNYEMPAFSYELLRRGLVKYISPRFNFCVSNIESAFYWGMKENCLKQIHDLSIFMHFAGCMDRMNDAKKLI
jgi:hypothetical protein